MPILSVFKSIENFLSEKKKMFSILFALSASRNSRRYKTNSADGNKIAEIAKSKIGSKYVYGKAGPNAFDNAGLIYYAHKAAGIQIQRLAKNMYENARVVRGDPRPGDILCFRFKEEKKTAEVPKMAIVTSKPDTSKGCIKYVTILYPNSVVFEGTEYQYEYYEFRRYC